MYSANVGDSEAAFFTHDEAHDRGFFDFAYQSEGQEQPLGQGEQNLQLDPIPNKSGTSCGTMLTRVHHPSEHSNAGSPEESARIQRIKDKNPSMNILGKGSASHRLWTGDGTLATSRGFGDAVGSFTKKQQKTGAMSHRPAISRVVLSDKADADQVLVVASDGVWDAIKASNSGTEHRSLLDVVNDSQGSTSSFRPVAIADSLIAEIRTAYDTRLKFIDNVSFIVVDLTATLGVLPVYDPLAHLFNRPAPLDLSKALPTATIHIVSYVHNVIRKAVKDFAKGRNVPETLEAISSFANFIRFADKSSPDLPISLAKKCADFIIRHSQTTGGGNWVRQFNRPAFWLKIRLKNLQKKLQNGATVATLPELQQEATRAFLNGVAEELTEAINSPGRYVKK